MSFVTPLIKRRFLAAFLALGLALVPALAEAKAGGGSSFGSRGTRTYSAPPVTNTAPRSASPIERSITPQGAPAALPSRPSAGGLFGGGLGRGFLGGLLGAGLFGMLFGHGLMGGIGGIGSLFGLLLQVGLVFLLVRLGLNWFANRQKPGLAGAAPGSFFGSGNFSPFRSDAGGLSGAGPGVVAAAPIELESADFPGFERLLDAVQIAFGAEDIDRLRQLATPEMAAYFAQDLAENARKGIVNRISGVKLLQGDLSEAWREQGVDYATVAMRFSLIDVMLERGSNRIVSGDASNAIETTEIWTFCRPAGSGSGSWMLSAIQQA